MAWFGRLFFQPPVKDCLGRSRDDHAGVLLRLNTFCL